MKNNAINLLETTSTITYTPTWPVLTSCTACLLWFSVTSVRSVEFPVNQLVCSFYKSVVNSKENHMPSGLSEYKFTRWHSLTQLPELTRSLFRWCHVSSGWMFTVKYRSLFSDNYV